MKRNKRILLFVLIIAMLSSNLCGCSPAKETNINRVKLTFPEITKEEALVNTTAMLSVNYYLTARAYLDKWLSQDVSDMTQEEFEEFTLLLKQAIALFEDVEKLSATLNKVADVWETKAYENKPAMEKISKQNLNFVNPVAIYAANPSPAKKWAQDIVDTFDKAPAGKGIRTLAKHLDTDAKRAYIQLKQALDILEGEEYTEISKKANTAIQVASALKTAGSIAQLGIAIAAAPPAGVLGAVTNTGGLVCSGASTLLEIGSTGSIIYYNGEDNHISIACDKTQAQFGPIGQVFSVMSLGYGLKDLGTSGKEIFKNGYKSLSADDKHELGKNAFGILSYGTSGVMDYVNDGSILSGTITVEDGKAKFTLIDTLTGASSEDVKSVLEETGIEKSKIEEALKSEGKTVKIDGPIPNEIADKIIEENAGASLGKDFPLDEFLQAMEEALQEFSDMQLLEKEEQKPDGGKWVDPFEYYKISTIAELYEILEKTPALKMEVTPSGHDNYDCKPIPIENTAPFVIDLREDAVTIHHASYTWPEEYRSEITYTFTGTPGDIDPFKVGIVTREKIGSAFEESDQTENAVIFPHKTSDNVPEIYKKSVDIDNLTPYTILFKVNRLLITEE